MAVKYNLSTDIESLKFRRIFIFWVPLAATWLMMSFEGPYLAAIIARLPDPKFNLAAYGVAFSFALIIEAPIIMIMSASTALVNGYESFKKLRNFTYTTNIVITLLMLVLIIPSVFYFIAMDVISLPEHVADLTYWAIVILLPWPGAIGYRRFYQGILIRYGLTRRVAYGTILRIISMSATGLVLFLFFELPGAVVGASALSAGVIIEAIASKLMTFRLIKEVRDKTDDEQLSYADIFKFYYPLALTSMLGLGVHPIVTFFMGQSRFPLESLAVLPVINSLVFIFRSIGLSFQEVGIALMGKNKEGYEPLRNFALTLGISVFVILTSIAFTQLSDFWFRDISGLSETLASFANLPLQILAILPSLTLLLSFQRALLVHDRHTQPITAATAIEVGGIVLILLILINAFDFVGVTAAAIAFLMGRLGAVGYLWMNIPKVKSSVVNHQ